MKEEQIIKANPDYRRIEGALQRLQYAGYIKGYQIQFSWTGNTDTRTCTCTIKIERKVVSECSVETELDIDRSEVIKVQESCLSDMVDMLLEAVLYEKRRVTNVQSEKKKHYNTLIGRLLKIKRW